jgi:excisionase family DNA binding protein
MDYTEAINKLQSSIDSLHEKIDRIEEIILNPEKGGVPTYLNVKQAASFLGLEVPTIYSKVNRGELTYIKRGKKLLFLHKDLTDYLMHGRVLARR